MFIAKQCNGCSVAPLTQYNNEIQQEIMTEDEYATNNTDIEFGSI